MSAAGTSAPGDVRVQAHGSGRARSAGRGDVRGRRGGRGDRLAGRRSARHATALRVASSPTRPGLRPPRGRAPQRCRPPPSIEASSCAGCRTFDERPEHVTARSARRRHRLEQSRPRTGRARPRQAGGGRTRATANSCSMAALVRHDTAHLLVPRREARSRICLDEAGNLLGRRDGPGARGALERGRESSAVAKRTSRSRESAAHDHVVEPGRSCAPICRSAGDRRVHHLLQRVDRLLAAKEAPPRDALPQHDRHREDVALRACRCAACRPARARGTRASPSPRACASPARGPRPWRSRSR